MAISLACFAGCRTASNPPAQSTSILGDKTPMSQATPAQVADVQIAMGRAAEKRGDLPEAMAAYQEALKRDSKRADAALRLASLKVKQGKFQESEALYRQALKADPGNPDAFSDMGYSLYLQRRWAEAEMNLNQAIALRPDHQRAHNNLGLVLAHNARATEALAEFRKAGCSPADAHNNLAFALTMDRKWAAGREQYRLALAAEPSSAATKARLKELDALIAKVDRGGKKELHDAKLITASTTVASRPKVNSSVPIPVPRVRPAPAKTAKPAQTKAAAPAPIDSRTGPPVNPVQMP